MARRGPLREAASAEDGQGDLFERSSGELRTELHGAWAGKLRHWWHHYNLEYLKEALRPPTFRISGGQEALGVWHRGKREIAISAGHIAVDPWEAVLDTLRHEMAHQYAHEVLGASEERPHGRAFQEACERLRCDAGARVSRESLKGAADTKDDALLRRLKKLMSLAGSPNEHEAQAAMEKARRLLVAYNIDVVELDRERRFSARTLGPMKARHTTSELWMASLLHQYFFVETIWTPSYDARSDRSGTVLRVYGTPENLDMAEYVHGYLFAVMDGLWADYRGRTGIRGDRERQRYFAGVLEGFVAKLSEQETRLARTEALAWKGDPQLKTFYRHINPNVTTRFSGGMAWSPAFNDGVREGRNVTIHRPVEARESGGRLLTGDSEIGR